MSIDIRVIAPDGTTWDANAEEIILPSSTGQLGILSGHAPLLTAIDIGVMRVRIGKNWTPVILMGGFAEIEDNKLTIVVNGIEETSQLNLEQAKANLEKSLEQLDQAQSNKQKIELTQNVRKARARVQALTATLNT
uniref:ATP synthase CF1 epsilon subunit n=1 Tax=Bangiopsis subsimplex TaxID=139980 RepID=A0A1C9CCT6_9RHOD|nr:ATP synthase CF1 epsilon subunit [Bangiopsis subsimplex]AOM66172.1 ATP synthase CF1 epsilon subunit [Bangiopsis subsimplex]ARO90468.1 ATP synthase CF1 subunit epsilon [Bangiopsis subsimplex]